MLLSIGHAQDSLLPPQMRKYTAPTVNAAEAEQVWCRFAKPGPLGSVGEVLARQGVPPGDRC